MPRIEMLVPAGGLGIDGSPGSCDTIWSVATAACAAISASGILTTGAVTSAARSSKRPAVETSLGRTTVSGSSVTSTLLPVSRASRAAA